LPTADSESLPTVLVAAIPRYGEVRYAAGKWPCLRRVVIKAEVVRAPEKDPKDNPLVDLRTGLLPAR
jgi:hypothetical protein